jgi:hypothetical protein
MQTVETFIRITTLDERQGENEETAMAHHGPTRRAVGLVVICRGKRDSTLQHRREREGHASFSFPLARALTSS